MSVGGSEGYGEQRLCISCHGSTIKKTNCRKVQSPVLLKKDNRPLRSSNAPTKDSRQARSSTAPFKKVARHTHLSTTEKVQSKRTISQDLNEEEKWNRVPKRKRSYLTPTPNWSLCSSEQKLPKIGFLVNANLSTNAHKINGKLVKIKNFCAFDSLCQVMRMTACNFSGN